MARLGVVIASVREGRIGLPIAERFLELARTASAFDVSLLDLKAVDLPLLAEPNHPRLRQYESARTKSWSETVASFDAFVFVTPEYNFSAAPALLNALDHLYVEWNYKPAGFVSYGGISGGLRAVQMAKQVLGALKMVPLVEAVTIPFASKLIDADARKFRADEAHARSAATMLKELARWSDALAVLRA
jgi:NAD(P)H-dependent FMN reductase